MKRTGRTLSLGCLLLLLPTLAVADGNSLLIPATGSCSLNVAAEDLPAALQACQQSAEGEVATQVLGQIFRNYLQELQAADSLSPFAPLK